METPSWAIQTELRADVANSPAYTYVENSVAYQMVTRAPSQNTSKRVDMEAATKWSRTQHQINVHGRN